MPKKTGESKRKARITVEMTQREKLIAKVQKVIGALSKLLAPKYDSANVREKFLNAKDKLSESITQLMALPDAWKPGVAKRKPSPETIAKIKAKLAKLEAKLAEAEGDEVVAE